MASLDHPLTASPSLAVDSRTAVRIWLIAMAALVFAMVLVGGATRLTESGLSITQWKPVTGVLPPLNAAEWQAEFDRYKQIPQYSRMNSDMTLQGFQSIFWWEWSHRLLARVIGLAFIAPALWFWVTGRFKGALGRQVLIATGLLALEPIVGWWMVSSGLSARTEVAQDRLAIHLLIAAGTFGALIYAATGLARTKRTSAPRAFSISAGLLAALLYCQLGLGALVAGLRAGMIYNSWPLMGDGLMPREAFPAPWPLAMLDDPATAQFLHRSVGYAVLIFALAQGFAALRQGVPSLGRRAAILAGVALVQVGLGITTLLLFVPVGIALAHQATALVVFGLAVWHWKETRMEGGG